MLIKLYYTLISSHSVNHCHIPTRRLAPHSGISDPPLRHGRHRRDERLAVVVHLRPEEGVLILRRRLQPVHLQPRPILGALEEVVGGGEYVGDRLLRRLRILSGVAEHTGPVGMLPEGHHDLVRVVDAVCFFAVRAWPGLSLLAGGPTALVWDVVAPPAAAAALI